MKAQRTKLVNAALSAIAQLRTHLLIKLGGTHSAHARMVTHGTPCIALAACGRSA